VCCSVLQCVAASLQFVTVFCSAVVCFLHLRKPFLECLAKKKLSQFFLSKIWGAGQMFFVVTALEKAQKKNCTWESLFWSAGQKKIAKMFLAQIFFSKIWGAGQMFVLTLEKAHTAASPCNNTLQHTATHCNAGSGCVGSVGCCESCNALKAQGGPIAPQCIQVTHCNTLQHTATHCNTLQHTATHCNTLQHTPIALQCLQVTHMNTHMNKSCPTCGLVMSHIWMIHVSLKWVMSHIWMSHVAHLSESCLTYE